MIDNNNWKFGTSGFTDPDGISWRVMPAGNILHDPEPVLKRLAALAGKQAQSSQPETSSVPESFEYHENTARLMKNGDRVAVKLIMETRIRDKGLQQLLLSEMLKATAEAEYRVLELTAEEAKARIESLFIGAREITLLPQPFDTPGEDTATAHGQELKESKAGEERPSAVPQRILELAKRLCIPGPKAAGVSASEMMEITDWIFETQAQAEAKEAARVSEGKRSEQA